MQDGYYHRGMFTGMLSQSVLRPARRSGGVGGRTEAQLAVIRGDADGDDPERQKRLDAIVAEMRQRRLENPYPPLGRKAG